MSATEVSVPVIHVRCGHPECNDFHEDLAIFPDFIVGLSIPITNENDKIRHLFIRKGYQSEIEALIKKSEEQYEELKKQGYICASPKGKTKANPDQKGSKANPKGNDQGESPAPGNSAA